MAPAPPGAGGGEVVGIAVGTVAHHLGVDVRTAGTGMLQLFQHQHAAAFAHHEAAAPCVKGQAGCIRIGRSGKRFHAGKAADARGLMQLSAPPQTMAVS